MLLVRVCTLLVKQRLIRRSAQRDVHSEDLFDIGRKDIQDMWSVLDFTISTHHLRFRSVMFEGDEHQNVLAMVYVGVLSSNHLLICGNQSDDNLTTHEVSKSDPDVLLSHGDELQLTPKMSIRFEARLWHSSISGRLNIIQMAEMEQFSDQFQVTNRTLGSGASASIVVAVKQQTQRQVACKILRVPFADPAELDSIEDDKLPTALDVEQARRAKQREYAVLKDIDHPNIIRLEKVICATRYTYIFQELITGGDLLSYIDKKGALCEAETAAITRQVLIAVDYLHDHGIVHRDIKPENILTTSWRPGARVVLTDFGQSRMLEQIRAEARDFAVSRMHSVVGTSGYAAPEVMSRELRRRGYSKGIDVWSIGCTTAILLTTRRPFEETSLDAEFEALNNRPPFECSDYDIESIMTSDNAWHTIGRKVKSFIGSCLKPEARRISVKQALQHVWFTNKHYARDIEEAYQRAISSWTPRSHDPSLVEVIDTSVAVSEAENSQASTIGSYPQPPAKSRYWPELTDTLPPPPTSLFRKPGGHETQDTFVHSLPLLQSPGPGAQETKEHPYEFSEVEDGIEVANVPTSRLGSIDQRYIAGPYTSDNLQHSPEFYGTRSSPSRWAALR